MATKPERKPAARAKRSKAEVQSEFEDLQEQTAARTAVDAKTQAAEIAHDEGIRAEVADVGVEAVVQRIAGLGLDVSRALSEVAEKLTAEVHLLGSLREAVAMERRELERLHQLDIAASAVDILVREHEEKSAAFEADMAGRRATWEAEAVRVERERREQEDGLKKQRQREIDDYEYRKSLERKKAQDKYDEEQRLTERKNAERQEALEKDWARREAALKEREEMVVRQQAEVAEFPARLARETEAAAQEARRQAEAQLERQIMLLKKDAEADKRVADLRIKALEETIAGQVAHVASLQKQLDQAKQQVQEIALQAIEGASGAKALAHINQIAMEQAKPRSAQN